MGGKSSPPPGPNYDKLMSLTEKNMAQNQGMYDDYMQFQRGVYQQQNDRADAYWHMIKPQMQGEFHVADLQRRRYINQGLPAENAYLDKLNGWDSPARREEAASQATADVSTAFAAERENQMRQLESFGIDPSQTRSAALDTRLGTQQAVAEAGAATTARRNSEKEGLAMQGEAVNIYRGMPAMAGSGSAGGAGLGGAGLTANGQSGQLGQGGYQVGAGILGQGQSMLASGYGTANQIYGNNLQAWQTQQANSPLNTIAGLAGTWMGAGMPGFSDGGYIHPDASPSRGAIPDDVAVRVGAGEVIMPDEVVRYHGLKTINKMHVEAKQAMAIPEY